MPTTISMMTDESHGTRHITSRSITTRIGISRRPNMTLNAIFQSDIRLVFVLGLGLWFTRGGGNYFNQNAVIRRL